MKCTIKDIADALQLSRNTVAKVLNHKEGVSDKTARLVLAKAREMNYQMIIDEGNAGHSGTPAQQILFLARASVNYSGFWISVMRGIETVLRDSEYSLQLAMMDDSDIKNLRFPPIINSPTVKGLILVELCDRQICEAALAYHLPTVTIDMPKDGESIIGHMDIVMMENERPVRELVNALIGRGCTDFAFAGDIYTYNVGRGFLERYNALIKELKAHDLSLNTNASLLHDTDQQLMNVSYIVSFLKRLKHLPQVYICGNDWTAIQLMHAVQFLGYSIPKDVSIIGFDNTIESANTLPPLTTVNTPKERLGIAAAKCLLERIEDPSIPYVCAQYMTETVIRESADLEIRA